MRMTEPMPLKKLVPKLLITVGIILLTVLFFESIARIIQVFNPPLNSYHQDFDLKYQLAKEHPESGKSIVFLGDSLTQRAVYTEYLQMLLKEKGHSYDVLNLATPGATPTISLNMLQHRVRRVGKPNLVVMGVTFRAFHYYWQTELINNENPNVTMNESFYGTCVFNKPEKFDAALLCDAKKTFLSVRYASELTQFFKDFPDYIFAPKRKMWSVRDEVNTLFFKKGWVPRKDEYMTHAEFKKYLSKKADEFKHYESRFNNADAQNWYTEKFITPLVTYCRKENIPLVLVLPPSTRMLNTVFYNDTLKMTKAKFVARLSQYARQNHIVFWDMSELFSKNEAHLFNDAIHLNVLGSLPYTQILADKINSKI